MQFATYFFASIISFLGLLIGVLLVKIAPEEQKPLEKSLISARKILLPLIFAFAIFYYYADIFYLLTLLAYFAFLLLAEHKINDLSKKSMLEYGMLGILFFLSSKNISLFAIESSLIMLYGLPTAALMYSIKKKNYYSTFLQNLIFIVIANLLFFV